MAIPKGQVAEGSMVCGRLGSVLMWRKHQAGFCFSRDQTEEPDPENTQGRG